MLLFFYKIAVLFVFVFQGYKETNAFIAAQGKFTAFCKSILCALLQMLVWLDMLNFRKIALHHGVS